MIAKAKSYSVYGLAAGIAAGAIHLAAPAAAFTVDGIVTTGTGADNYTSSYSLGFEVENYGPAPSTGVLRLGRGGALGDGDVFMHLTIPIDLVDNVYGPESLTGPAGYGTKERTFDKVVSSDKFEFKIKTDLGFTPLLRVGYTDSSGNPDELITGGVLTAQSTSLQYNLTAPTTTFGNTTSSPDPYPPADVVDGGITYKWQQELQYEFRFAGAQFSYLANGENIGLADISMPLLHASPNKLGKNRIHIPCLENADEHHENDDKVPHGHSDPCTLLTGGGDPPPTAASEPASGALMLAGLGVVSLYRRRRAKA